MDPRSAPPVSTAAPPVAPSPLRHQAGRSEGAHRIGHPRARSSARRSADSASPSRRPAPCLPPMMSFTSPAALRHPAARCPRRPGHAGPVPKPAASPQRRFLPVRRRVEGDATPRAPSVTAAPCEAARRPEVASGRPQGPSTRLGTTTALAARRPSGAMASACMRAPERHAAGAGQPWTRSDAPGRNSDLRPIRAPRSGARLRARSLPRWMPP